MDQIDVQGIFVDVVRKKIKNLRLSVYPPDGKVRVTAPFSINDEAIKYAITKKMHWIQRQQAKFNGQTRPSPIKMVSGESHYFLGQSYSLHVIEHEKSASVIHNGTVIELYVQHQSTILQRKQILQKWYRNELKALIPEIIHKWQPLLNVFVNEWGVKKMKTRWGSCNRCAARIWLNLELIKKPIHCLEYVVVHEMLHLIEKRHNSRFKALLDQVIPYWRLHQKELNLEPL